MTAPANTLQDKRITIALPKGRLLAYIENHFIKRNLYCNFGGRALICEDVVNNIRWILVKNSDVPIYVHTGVAEMGIAGSDILNEYDYPISRLHSFDFGQAALCLIAQTASTYKDVYNGVKIASKYPHTTKRYLQKQGIEAQIIQLNGSLEIAPILQLAPFIVDIVQTGTTLTTHNLKVCETIATTEIVLVANLAYYKINAVYVDNLVERFS